MGYSMRLPAARFTAWPVVEKAAAVSVSPRTVGDVASLVSDAGQMDNVAVVPFDIPPGNCMPYYPEANILTDTTVDPRSRTPSFKSTPVTILPNARH